MCLHHPLTGRLQVLVHPTITRISPNRRAQTLENFPVVRMVEECAERSEDDVPKILQKYSDMI